MDHKILTKIIADLYRMKLIYERPVQEQVDLILLIEDAVERYLLETQKEENYGIQN